MNMKKLISAIICLCVISVHFHFHERESTDGKTAAHAVSLITGEQISFNGDPGINSISDDQCAVCNFINAFQLLFIGGLILYFINTGTTYISTYRPFPNNCHIDSASTRAPPR